MDDDVKSEFARIADKFSRNHQRLLTFEHAQQDFEQRLKIGEERFQLFMAGIAQQFEVMQKYMDRRFNEVLEALDVRVSPAERKLRDHERRIRKLEEN